MNTTDAIENTSGRVRIEGSAILWDYQNKNIVRIEKEDIAVIGEYTNADGPYFDDWFIVFVTKDGNWQHIPRYAGNMDELERFLCDHFEDDFHVSYLTGSTTWNSIIRYPLYLKGTAVFTLTPGPGYNPPKGFWAKLLFAIGAGKYNTDQLIELTDEVKAEVLRSSH